MATQPLTGQLRMKEETDYPELYKVYEDSKTVAKLLIRYMTTLELGENPTTDESMEYMHRMFAFFECFYRHIHFFKDNKLLLEEAIILISEHVETMGLYDLRRAKLYFETIHSLV